MKENFYLVLAGGVGAAKFIDGLSTIIPQEELKVVINTGDDIALSIPSNSIPLISGSQLCFM